MPEMTYEQAIKSAEHLIALGQTTVYVEAETAPWDKAKRIEDGGCYRFNGPVNFYVIAEEAGLTLKWSVDMEKRDASGRGVSWFDRDRLRDVANKLPPGARLGLAAFFERAVMPDLKKRTNEIREALNAQLDSEDCVRGLIAFAKA